MESNRRNFLKAGLAGLAAGSISTTAIAATGSGKVDRRRFGKIGKDVSILGLGLGSSYYKPYDQERETGQMLLESALKAGINYWDTSHNYSTSEDIIAPVVEKHRNEIYLVSKSAQRSYDGFQRELESSLKRLRTDKIDLYHLHNIRPNDSLDEMEKGCFRAVYKAKEEGVIKSFGVTGHSGAGLLVDAIKRFDPDALLTIFPCNRPDNGRYEDDLLPLARERNMGVVGMKTVKHARNADLKGPDLIRYALGLEGVHSVIVGLDTMAHLQENIEMASGFKPLSQQEQLALTHESQRALVGLTAPWDVPGYEDSCPHV